MTENALLVTVDSLRYDYVSAFGHERETTPFLDSRAQTGSVFHNAYAHMGGTRMSFPTILASTTPLMYGGYEEITDEQTLVSEAFSDAGFSTAGFHSNLYLAAHFGYGSGFDTFFDSREDSSLDTKLRQFVTSNLEETPLYPILKKMHSLVESTGGVNVGSYIVPADDLTDMAIEWASDQSPASNFLWIHYMDPHHPYLPPTEIRKRFLDEPISDPEALKLRRKALEKPGEVTQDDIQTLRRLYEGEIYFTDQQIGRLVEAVEDRWDDTIIAVTADHGEQFDEHGEFRGDPLYEEMTHVPLIIDNWDDQGEYESLVGLADVAPTLLDHAGVKRPSSFTGTSLRLLVSGEGWDRDTVIGGFVPGDDPMFTYRSADWRYVVRPDAPDELYDVRRDPREQVNVIDDEPEVAAGIRDEVDEHQQRMTARGRADVEMDEDIRQRLRNLGYQE